MVDRSIWDIDGTAKWIGAVLEGNVAGQAKICLQLPDELLKYAPELSLSLQSAPELENRDIDVFILADTTYNSLSVDEVASAHVDAQCIVHYGRASLSKTTGRVPVYYVFPQEENYRYGGEVELDLGNVSSTSGREGAAPTPLTATCFVDQVFKHLFDEVCAYIRDELFSGFDIAFPALVDAEGVPSVGGYATTQGQVGTKGGGDDGEGENTRLYIWYGPSDSSAKELLMLTYNARRWVSIDPLLGTVEYGLPPKLYQTLRKRYFLVDKARQANIVGIVVGTLAADGYKESINALRVAATKADKKTYTLLMGKPSPAKLANFPEIDVFVLVADPQGMILDSKEYYAPIITPYEAMLAFSDGTEWEQHMYSLELTVDNAPGVIGEAHENDHGDERPEEHALVLQAQEALQVANIHASKKGIIIPSSSAEYLIHKRTWKGVDSGTGPHSEKKEARAVEMGLSGRAAGYGHEC